MASNETDSLANRLTYGAGLGAAAYLLGYVLTFLLTNARATREWGEIAPAWKVVGWYYYNAHFVSITASRSVGPFGDSGALNFIANAESGTMTFLYVVPILVLLVGGGLAAYLHGDADPVGAAKTGATAVLGYGVLAVLGGILVSHTSSGSFFGVDVSLSIQPQLSSVVIIVAILYPVVVATIGAVLAVAVFGENSRVTPA